MKTKTKYLACYVALALAILAPTAVQAMDREIILEQIRSLDWKIEADTYSIKNSKAKLTISEDELLVQGTDAHKYMLLSEGRDGLNPDAVVLSYDGVSNEETTIYQFLENGYLTTNDWSEKINKDELFSSVQKSTREANKSRTAGYPSMYVDEWAQEPYLDSANSIAYWAILGHSSDGIEFINAKALKLGRYGYVIITWIGSPSQFKDAKAVLASATQAYQFETGAKYTDFNPSTDTVAAFGIGALTYKMITGKQSKTAGAGIAAVIAILAKKLWFVLALPFIFLGGVLKRILFRR